MHQLDSGGVVLQILQGVTYYSHYAAAPRYSRAATLRFLYELASAFQTSVRSGTHPETCH